MSTHARPVYKYNLKGQLIDRYPSLKQAAKVLRMQGTDLKEIINGCGFIAGYVYSWSDKGIPPLLDNVQDFGKPQPWEKNGYFDINGWAKSCLY